MKCSKTLLHFLLGTWVIALLPVMGGCGSSRIPLLLAKTTPKDSIVLERMGGAQVPKRLLFISDKEASCPHQCSGIIKSSESYNKFVSSIEQSLMKQGFDIISGAVVSKVEEKMKDNNTREEWDRVEKALLLGKETGADAVFEIKALYVDEYMKTYLKETSTKDFQEVPTRYAFEALQKDYGASQYNIGVWEASVELRMIDMSGKILWSGSKAVRTTDVIPSDWTGELHPVRPNAIKAEENFKYNTYLFNVDLIDSILMDIIQQLIDKMPKP